ncbi:Elongation factor 1-delta [Parelaphostrongylus tenuis]|uniref:Elongation factor 1-delta n=1 Tax=Parelaphostrongylus tenuis TaxID=148309 RepID=A0AAD5R464_PARTN|nr:Elongation factor 1-delta [Parelaphostrongylus tenuis]
MYCRRSCAAITLSPVQLYRPVSGQPPTVSSGKPIMRLNSVTLANIEYMFEMPAIDGLLSEKCMFLDSNLALRAADEAYFGGRQVYTSVSPSSSRSRHDSHRGRHGNHDSHRGHHGGHDSHRGHHGEHDSRHGHHGEHDSRHGHHEQHSGHQRGHKHPHGKELIAKGDMHVVPKDSLHQEVKALRKENEEIKKELAELREAIENFTRKQVIPVKDKHDDDSNVKGNSGDEDFDLFGSDDEEDAEKAKIVEERLKAYHEKKSKKPGPIAKSSVIFDVKPWDDETNLEEMENLVRGIEMDGLVWGGGKLIPVGYGIKKLQIISVIEDDKVSVDDLVEKITGDFESHVQSVDIVAFNKI